MGWPELESLWSVMAAAAPATCPTMSNLRRSNWAAMAPPGGKKSCGVEARIQRFPPGLLEVGLFTFFIPRMLAMATLLFADAGEKAQAADLLAVAGRFPFSANSRWRGDL